MADKRTETGPSRPQFEHSRLRESARLNPEMSRISERLPPVGEDLRMSEDRLYRSSGRLSTSPAPSAGAAFSDTGSLPGPNGEPDDEPTTDVGVLRLQDGGALLTEEGSRIALQSRTRIQTDEEADHEAGVAANDPDRLRYERGVPLPKKSVNPADWTGKRSVREQGKLITKVAPQLASELDALVLAVEEKRYNDPETANTLALLKALHRDLGDLIAASERGLERSMVKRLTMHNQKLVQALKTGSKVFGVAPIATIGIVHTLAFLTGVPVDSTLVSTVWGSLVTMDVGTNVAEKMKR